MFHRIAPSVVLPPAVAGVATVLLGLALPVGAAVASTGTASPKPPTPVSNSTCWGSLKPAPVGDEPNLLSYRFDCNTPITGYTILANRRAWDANVIDDFNTSPLATLGDRTTPDPHTSWVCEGTVPANGFNCNAGPGGTMAAWDYAEGTLDTSDPYCGIPANSAAKTSRKRAGGLSGALPRAIVQLVVTDSTGAEDGPFVLSNTVACRATKKPHRHHRHG